MSDRPLSIFSVALRSLVKTFMGVFGIALALILCVLLLSVDTGSDEIEKSAKIQVLPNLQGVRTKLDDTSPVLLELPIVGVIGSNDLNREVIEEILQESKEGDLKGNRVKGLLLRLDSPGGGSIDSDGIYRAIKRYKEELKIPVIAYIDGISASGGMYIAVAADEIWATESSIIGSIGTLIQTQLNFSKPLSTYGVEQVTFTAGKGKDALNPFRPWSESDRESLQPIVDAHYEDFVNIVTQNRPRLSKEKLIQEYGAKVFPAKQAEEYGYVDVVGKTKNEALKALAERAGVKPEEVFVVTLEKKHWLRDLFKSETQSVSDTLLRSFGVTPKASPRLDYQPLWLWTP